MPDTPPDADLLFALALERLDGVGRVTAGRLLQHFRHYDDLCRYPREQVLARIKGAPNGEALVARLFDEAFMKAQLHAASEALGVLRQRHITLLTPQSPAWPPGLDALPRASRPAMLYTYGALDVLSHPAVGFFARTPLSEAAFEQAQQLVRHTLAADLIPATGATDGFDVVVHKLAAASSTRGALMVVPAGLARLAPRLRPTAAATVRAGGLLVSPFSPPHGPFAHDDRERALLQAALCKACVFVEPASETPEMQALRWALDAGRPVFGLARDPSALPDRVHSLQDDIGVEWLLAAARPPEEASR